MKNIWKDIKGFEGYYQVSRFGEVKSLDRVIDKEHHYFQRILKKLVSKEYYSVALCKDGKVIRNSVHVLVAKAFVPGYAPGLEVNHKDGNKKNNYYKNLEWITKSGNKIHAHYILGKDVMKIKALFPNGKETIFKSQREASRKLNIKHSSICNVINGNRKTAGGLKFEKLS
jgi:NUMOD4 motif/HNH endonuclease